MAPTDSIWIVVASKEKKMSESSFKPGDLVTHTRQTWRWGIVTRVSEHGETWFNVHEGGWYIIYWMNGPETGYPTRVVYSSDKVYNNHELLTKDVLLCREEKIKRERERIDRLLYHG